MALLPLPTASFPFFKASRRAVTTADLPFPIEINTGNHYQIFNVAKADGSRDMAIEVARVRQVGNRIFSYSAFDNFRLNDGAPVPERWQHVLTQEDFALKAISK